MIAQPERPSCASNVLAPLARHAQLARSLVAALLILLTGLPGGVARAERADRDKPVQVEADAMTYDDAKQVNVFTGSVRLTKGTILLTAERLVLRQDTDGFQYGTATGTPARFRQKRDGPGDQYVAGEALRIEYDGKTETVRLIQKAMMNRLEGSRVTDEVHGNLIVYESRSEFVTVESGGPKAATPENPGGRVKVIIQPKSSEADKSAPATLSPARKLESTPR
jgi:lipopolysaccharide export system protein LptA